ncbi:cytochrome c3 family protein [Anaeromyxobacter paludicola]|uniref:Cytochrome c n=1 Tax=Anaeromyxobacter paludicola TaxID=2918171 RepID=A0ABM7X6F0_9BACT|nr:cytochrome c3 family protein [Anaeromyxobacter paludicola]BDG07412.1 cytochrome c [Anaeromyxobacter paludicola]
MRNLLKFLAVVALVMPLAGQAQIKNSRHDLSSSNSTSGAVKATSVDQVCIFCHVPHNAQTTLALWNRKNPTSTYTWTDSINNGKTSQGTTLPTTAAQFSANGSLRCLSCHDGSIALGDVMNMGGSATTIAITDQASRTSGGKIVGTSPYDIGVGGDLRKNHPVGVPFPGQTGTTAPVGANQYYGATNTGCSTNSGGGCVNNGTAGKALPLYLNSGNALQIECASCHEPHNTANGTFLRASNAGSALCLTCHQK